MNGIRVGTFALYPSDRRLLAADGRPVELGARAFDLLLALAEQPGRLVTKNALIERVWPRLIVEENNLVAQVASLRRALGAGAIRTVPGYGYRLELPVADGAAASAPPAQAPTPTPTPPDVPQHGLAPREPPRLQPARRAWPSRLSPLLGREREIAELRTALAREHLVTLLGVAGIGKTRLAQELLALEGETAGTAATWVSLRPLADAARLRSAIALALGLSLPEDDSGLGALAQALEGTSLLLVLDGAEHLVDALAAPLAALLAEARGLRALVTSQVPLRIAGERVYRLEALELPPRAATSEALAASTAVGFFVQRATAADARFALGPGNAAQVAEICRRLDGNPLALELAAARVPSLGVAALLERLDDRFRLLRQAPRGDSAEPTTLQAAFDWSYGLLGATERQVFDALGAFAGSFTLDAAAHCVADDAIDVTDAVDLVGRLADRSLVSVLPLDPPRYALPETARCYARARLAATGRGDAVRRRCAAAMLRLLDTAYREYWSLDEAIWLARYEPDLDNVRSALEWAIGSDRELAVGLLGSAWPLFVEADLHAEGHARFEQVLGLLNDRLPGARVGRFWEAVATFESGRRYDRARYAAELAAGLHGAAGDVQARYYSLLLLSLNAPGDPAAAHAAWDAARALEDPAWPARLLALGATAAGALAAAAGEHAAARGAYAQAVRHAVAASERQALAATVRVVELDIACGDLAGALQLARPLTASLRRAGRRETRFEALGLAFTALLLAGERDEARELGAELLDLARHLDGSPLYSVLDAMACLASVDGRHAVAVRVACCADAARARHGQVGRRPAEQRARETLERSLGAALGPDWCAAAAERAPTDAAAACALALGLVA
ncbi:MAG: winged helix-turn-helix domain-containing protein [Steroidobacteraceae bacterium]